MKKTIIVTAVITALVTWILTLIIFNGLYLGKDAEYWNEQYVQAETIRSLDYTAITCIRGLGYTNLPGLKSYYYFEIPSLLDSAGNYYSKGSVDGCLFGL